MDKFNHFLRRRKPWQIAALGAATWVAGLAVVIFVFCPLANSVLPGSGLAVAILGGIAVGLTPRVFTVAYLDRKHDDMMLAMIEQWQRDKEASRGGSL
jgi:hypothetical protein